MLKSAKFWVATLCAGTAVGLGIAGWMQWSSNESRLADHGTSGANSGLALSPRSSNTGTALSVISDGNQGNVNYSTGGQNVTQSEGQAAPSGSAASSSSPSAGLPGPSDFGPYNAYSTSPTTLFIDAQVGAGKAIADGSVATVQYQGWLTNGTLFDSTYARKQSFTFTEGAGTVIPGWEEGLFGMKVGGERRLIVPPGLAFGAKGHGPVPANSVLIFDVTLVSIQ